MSRHPYRDAPSASFWSSFSKSGFATADISMRSPAALRPGARVVSAGSCFAANLVPYLERRGLRYIRTEYQNILYKAIAPEALAYGKFSAGYGNIYTSRQLLQLILRCTGQWTPVEDRWITDTRVIDPFRPGLKYAARTEREFDVLTRQHLRATRRALTEADLFVVTLGLTEAWASTIDGAVFPACPGTVAGRFDPKRHHLVNFSVEQVRDDLVATIEQLRKINPDVDVVVTVSPVPLIATAEGGHVLTASTYSKSVLRVAADEVVRQFERVDYFPAFEIVTGPQARREFFADDRRTVTHAGIESVMEAFFGRLDDEHGSYHESDRAEDGLVAALSEQIATFECEEAFAEAGRDTDAR